MYIEKHVCFGFNRVYIATPGTEELSNSTEDIEC